MALTCRQAARISLAALGGHAAEAERLQLEDHLASCARCSEEHDLTQGVVSHLCQVEPDALTPSARDAVRATLGARAAVGAGAAPRVLRARGLGAGLWLAGAAAAAVGAVVAFGALRGRSERVVAGDVTVSAPAASRDGTATTTYLSEAGGQVVLDGAAVELARQTEIAWNRGLGRVELRRGGVTVEVRRPGQQFEVRTVRFMVEVAGARCAVDLGGVHAERGVVRVLRPDGSVAARVEAGQTWTAETTAAAVTPPPVAAAAPAVPQPTPAAPATRSHLRTPAESTPAVRLAEARGALARGDAPAARRIVSPLFHLDRDVGVEARILFAESFLVEGRYADAIDRYRVVVRDFPGTSQAESAQFALAQLASEHGRADEAHAALNAYLARYPQGRFAREAARRLAKLSPRER